MMQAYIKLTGIYTNHNGYMYKIIYTIYPGANATDDFTIKTNRHTSTTSVCGALP